MPARAAVGCAAVGAVLAAFWLIARARKRRARAVPTPPQRQRPGVEDAAQILLELYGIGNADIKELPSYDDVNFLVRPKDGKGPTVLKVYTADSEQSLAILDMQDRVLDHMER